MIHAIVYTSNTGNAQKYAENLGEKTGLPVLSLKEAEKSLEPKRSILYLGWVMAGSIKGYKKAKQLYDIRAVCGVGMGCMPVSQDDVRKQNEINTESALFMLPGGFNLSKLKGIYKMMMSMMSKSIIKDLSEKETRTAEEDEILEAMQKGKSFVSEKNLKDVLCWYENLK